VLSFISYTYFISLCVSLKRIHLFLSIILHLSSILQRHLLEDRTPIARHNYCFVYHFEFSRSSTCQIDINLFFEAFNLSFINSVLFVHVMRWVVHYRVVHMMSYKTFVLRKRYVRWQLYELKKYKFLMFFSYISTKYIISHSNFVSTLVL